MDTQKALFVFIDNSITPCGMNGVWLEVVYSIKHFEWYIVTSLFEKLVEKYPETLIKSHNICQVLLPILYKNQQ